MFQFSNPSYHTKRFIASFMTYFCLGVYLAFGQNSTDKKVLDSILNEAKEETTQMRYDEAIYSASNLLSRSRQVEADAYISEGYQLLSQNQTYLHDSTFVEDYARKALHFALKSGNDTLIVNANDNLGDLLSRDRARRKEAEKMYLAALAAARRGYRKHIATSSLNLARLYHDMDTVDLMPRHLREAEANLPGLLNTVSDEEIRLNILWGEYFDHTGGENLVTEYWATAYNMIKNKNAQEMAIYFYPKYAWFLNNIGKSAEAYHISVAYQRIKDDRDRHLLKLTLQKAMADAGADELKRQRNQAKLREEFADRELGRKKTQSTLMYVLTGVLLLFLTYLFISMRSRQKLVKNLRLKNVELTQAKETAEDSVKAKTEFFSTVSHEMRTPLYGVTGMVDVLQSAGASRSFEEEFNSLRFSAEHLLDVINDLLELSKLDDKTFEFNEHPFELDELMWEIIKSFERSHLKNTNKIHFEQNGTCPQFLMGDSRRIAQVLINLLSNAIKFTNNGHIYLTLTCKDSGKNDVYNILFEVRDTGVGIPYDKLEYIFKEFNQVENEDSAQNMGTGLGLAIVKKILRKLNSDITVESEINKGTKFSFELKLPIPENPPLIREIPAKPQHWDDSLNELLKGAHILVVDDNKVNRLVTSRLLEQKNIRVSLAPGGKDAIEIIKRHPVDLVLLDLHMPGMDGFETAERIRDFDKTTPIVALTATEIGPIKDRLTLCGFNDSVSKPFNAKEFYRILSKNLIMLKKQHAL